MITKLSIAPTSSPISRVAKKTKTPVHRRLIITAVQLGHAIVSVGPVFVLRNDVARQEGPDGTNDGEDGGYR